jgi:hypothetical protein
MSFPGKTTITNLTLTSANTEYSYTVPENTFKVQFKCRTSFDVKYSYTSGESGTTYVTLPSGATYWDDNINTSSTIYFQSATAGVVMEIQVWTGA